MSYLLRKLSREDLLYYNINITDAGHAAFKAGPPDNYGPALLQLSMYPAALAAALICGVLAFRRKQYASVLTSFWLSCSNVAEIVVFTKMVTSLTQGKMDRDLIDISASVSMTLTPVLMAAVASTTIQLWYLTKPRSSGIPNKTDYSQTVPALLYTALCIVIGGMLFSDASSESLPCSIQGGAVSLGIFWFLGGLG